MAQTSEKLPPVEPFVPEDELMENKSETDPVQGVADIVKRVTIENDTDRMRSATQLVNVFNFAIQVQAGRSQWLPSDYRAFAIALAALDSVGSVESEIANTLQMYQGNKRTE